MFYPIMQPSVAPLVEALCEILQHASELLLKQYTHYRQDPSHLHINHKSDHSPVTQADLIANTFIVHALQRLQPSYPVLSEEGEHHDRNTWSTFWLLDPLDGTKEFINKTDEFTINLSLMQQGNIEIAAIAVPTQRLIYIVNADQPPMKYRWDVMTDSSLLNSDTVVEGKWYGFKDHLVMPSTVLRLAMSRRTQKSPHYAQFIENLNQNNVAYQIVQAGSAYKFCLMLEGKIDWYVRFHPTWEWDTAAGQGLLQNSGGCLVDLKQQAFTYNQRDTLINGSFIAMRDAKDLIKYHRFMKGIID